MVDKLPAQILFFVFFFVGGLTLLIYTIVNIGTTINAHVTDYVTKYDFTDNKCYYTSCPLFTFDYEGKSYTSCSDSSTCVCNNNKTISLIDVQKTYPIGYSEKFDIRKNNPNNCSELENELAIVIIGSVFIVISFIFGYLIYIKKYKSNTYELELVRHRDSFSSI